MRFAHFDTITPGIIDAPLPWHQTQEMSTTPRALALAGLVVTAALLLVPATLMAGHLASVPGAALLLAEHPGAALRIALGLALASAIVGWPLYSTASRLRHRREVTIDAGRIAVTEAKLASKKTWSEPLSAYLGIAHHIRTTQAGPRHELVLVHPDASRHLVVAVADRISKSDVERAAATLGVAEVPARLLYRLPALPKVLALGRSEPSAPRLASVEA